MNRHFNANNHAYMYNDSQHRHQPQYSQPNGPQQPNGWDQNNSWDHDGQRQQQQPYAFQPDANIQTQIILAFKSSLSPEKTLFVVADIVSPETWDDARFLRYLKSQINFETSFVKITTVTPNTFNQNPIVLPTYIVMDEETTVGNFWSKLRDVINQCGDVNDASWFFNQNDAEGYLSDANYFLVGSFENLKDAITKRTRSTPSQQPGYSTRF